MDETELPEDETAEEAAPEAPPDPEPVEEAPKKGKAKVTDPNLLPTGAHSHLR
jgi:hypothetical protein